MNYEIIYKNKEFIIVNKPAGLLTHGAPHISENNLADRLLKKYPEIEKVGDDPWRPGIVHRLDKLASGLIVVARTQESFDNLKSQFMRRTVSKHYMALAHGKIEADEGEINFPIKRSAQGHKMAALPETVKGEKNISGRGAVTRFKVTKKFINYTLLQLEIKTGRTHQIRVHLCAYGYPLVGDDLYATKKTKVKNKKLDLNRIFLHAYKLEFKDLKEKTQKFEIELPRELLNFLKTIK